MSTLARHTLTHPEGRRLLVYGELRGGLDVSPPPAPAAALHQRRDLLTGAWVAVSPARNTRPQTGADVPAPPVPGAGADDGAVAGAVAGCPLCPGGPEVPFPYEAAVFENRFPTFAASPPPPPQGMDLVAPSGGRCEVVLYTDAHVGSLATLGPEQVCRVVAVWRDRSLELWSDTRHAYVLVFENRGEAVGATLSHPHGQIYAFDRMPPLTGQRVEAVCEYRDRFRRCVSCEVVARDDAAPARTVAENASFTVAVPFAARWPYEVHVRARRHGAARLGDLSPLEQRDLAAALAEVVARYDGLFGFPLPYMMVASESPSDGKGRPLADWHLAFEFLPPHRSETKLKVRASVETATGLFINDTLPEASAASLAAVVYSPPAWGNVEVPKVVPDVPAKELR